MDLGRWSCVGVIPEELQLIGIKAAFAHRCAHDSIAASSYTCDTPGPCSSGLRSFNYRLLRRPISPFDAPAFLPGIVVGHE